MSALRPARPVPAPRTADPTDSATRGAESDGHPEAPIALDVHAMRRGDAGALAACYRMHARHLLTVALRLTGSLEDAEDVVHDVFVRLPSALAQYEERGQLRAWLTRLTIRESLMHRRHERVRATVAIVEGADLASPTIDGDPVAAARVLRALAALSPALRHVFVLRAVHDYSHAEIAATLGISANTSEVRLHRAVRQLRETLESLR